MPSATAVLRKVRCRATSKRTGERCGQWCAPGHLTCAWHGGKSPQAQRAAQVRAALAEVQAAYPRRSVREIVSDAVHLSDLILQDAIAGMPSDQALSVEQVEALSVAAGRAAALARQASDLGVDVDSAEVVEQQRGELIAAALQRVASELVVAAGGTGEDQVAVRQWVGPAVAAALRSQEVPAAPKPWRMAHFPMIESGAVFRQREARQVAEALGGPRTVGEASAVSGSSGREIGSQARQNASAGDGSGRSGDPVEESPQQRDRRRSRAAGLVGGPFAGVDRPVSRASKGRGVPVGVRDAVAAGRGRVGQL